MRSAMRRNRLIGAAFLLLCCVGWELAARVRADMHTPGFLTVAGALFSQWAVLLPAAAETLARAAAGLALAVLIMLPAGVLLGRIRALGAVCEPVIDLLRPLPPLAIVPVVMLFAGTGSVAKIAVIFYGASIPILLNAMDGVRDLHPMLNRVSRSFRLGPLKTLFLVDLQAALPRIVSGVRLSLAASLLIAVSTEMLLSTDGLGSYLVKSQESFRIADGMAGLLVIAAGSLIINGCAAYLERRVLRWYYLRLGADDS